MFKMYHIESSEISGKSGKISVQEEKKKNNNNKKKEKNLKK